MASIQRKGFTQSQNQLSLIFKALAHPARLAIIDSLIKNENIICKELCADIPLAQATVSEHLKILFDSGILGYDKVENVTYYRVNPLFIEDANKCLGNIVQQTYKTNYDYRSTFFKILPSEN
jgi:DNA-binding transcriptional ArsR family regulator